MGRAGLLLLVVVLAGCGSAAEERPPSAVMTAADLERFVGETQPDYTDIRCAPRVEGWDFVCTFLLDRQRRKAGFLVAGGRLAGGTEPVPISERLSASGRPEPDREASFVLAANEVCDEAEDRAAELQRGPFPGRLATQAAALRQTANELMALEPAATGDQVAELYVLEGTLGNLSSALRALHGAVRAHAPTSAIRDVEASLANARRNVHVAARNLGLDCRLG